MIPYYCILSLALLGTFSWPFFKSRDIKSWIFLNIIIVLFLLSTLRYDVGMDYKAYFNIFLTNIDTNEYGFGKMRDIFRQVLGEYSPYIFFTLVSLVISVSVFKYISTYSKYPLLSLTIFLCFGQYFLATLNLVRQEVVIYLFWGFLINSIIKKKMICYITSIIVLSFLFHTTALILIPIYFLAKELNIRLKIVVFIFFLFSQSVLIQLIEASSYSIYLLMDDFTAKITILQIFFFVLSLFFFIVFQTLKNKNRYQILLENINFINLLFGCSMLMFSGTPIMQVCSRLSYYTGPIYIILIPNYIYSLKLKSNKMILYYFTAFLYAFIFIFALSTNGESQNLVPYKTIFSII